jgi:transcriptional regulator with XRE-family HTH domain
MGQMIAASRRGNELRFPNLLWAIAQQGPRYRFAAVLGESESWLSRRLAGRFEFSDEERQRIAQELGYPRDWLFQILAPPRVEPECSRREEA